MAYNAFGIPATRPLAGRIQVNADEEIASRLVGKFRPRAKTFGHRSRIARQYIFRTGVEKLDLWKFCLQRLAQFAGNLQGYLGLGREKSAGARVFTAMTGVDDNGANRIFAALRFKL